MFPRGSRYFAGCGPRGFFGSQQSREKIVTVSDELFEGRLSVALPLLSLSLFCSSPEHRFMSPELRLVSPELRLVSPELRLMSSFLLCP